MKLENGQEMVSVKVQENLSIVLTMDEKTCGLTTWYQGVGQGTTTIDKDTAIKLANRLLDWAGGGN